MIHRTDEHLPWRWLADRRDGVIAPARAVEADAHLATECRCCRARESSVRRVVAAVAAGALERPPAAADRRVVAAFASVRGVARRPAADVLFGALVLDQQCDLALAMRSDGADSRRLLWSLPGYEIDASLVAESGRCDVLGQIVPSGDEPGAAMSGEVRAVRGRRTIATAPVAPDGRFTFRGLPAGPQTFEGTVEGRAFVLPPVVLG